MVAIMRPANRRHRNIGSAGQPPTLTRTPGPRRALPRNRTRPATAGPWSQDHRGRRGDIGFQTARGDHGHRSPAGLRWRTGRRVDQMVHGLAAPGPSPGGGTRRGQPAMTDGHGDSGLLGGASWRSAIRTTQPSGGGGPATARSPPRLTRTPVRVAAAAAIERVRSAQPALAVAPRSMRTPGGRVTDLWAPIDPHATPPGDTLVANPDCGPIWWHFGEVPVVAESSRAWPMVGSTIPSVIRAA